LDSVFSSGCIISGGLARKSVLSRGVKVYTGAIAEESIILDDCESGRRARIRRAILDKNARVPDATVGYDIERDRAAHFVNESGIVVVESTHPPVEVTTYQLPQSLSGM
jgi:glucose-1-phosphate adenylyltransferase